jgi:hypothetical protein
MESEILEGYERLDDIRTLFREYAASLNVDLCFQGFEDELQSCRAVMKSPAAGCTCPRSKVKSPDASRSGALKAGAAR